MCFCYSANRWGAKYCDQHVCTSVCPLACLKNHTSKLHQIFCILPMVIARSSSDNNVVYGKAYGRGMSVSGRQCREGQSFSTSGRPLSALPPADWHPSDVSLSIHNGCAVFYPNLTCCVTENAELKLVWQMQQVTQKSRYILTSTSQSMPHNRLHNLPKVGRQCPKRHQIKFKHG